MGDILGQGCRFRKCGRRRFGGVRPLPARAVSPDFALRAATGKLLRLPPHSHATGIPLPHLSGMKSGKRRCTPEYDLRLSRYFGTSRGYWMRLQLSYDMDRTQRQKGAEIDRSMQVAAGQ